MIVHTDQQLKTAYEQCASEQIHLYASIQPHGALLILAREANLTVLQASENIDQFFDIPSQDVLNQPLAKLIGYTPTQMIAQCIEDLSEHQDLSLSIESVYKNQPIRLSVHIFASSHNTVGLEFFPDNETLSSTLAPPFFIKYTTSFTECG